MVSSLKTVYEEQHIKITMLSEALLGSQQLQDSLNKTFEGRFN